jgi:hypothetical protein
MMDGGEVGRESARGALRRGGGERGGWAGGGEGDLEAGPDGLALGHMT